MNLQKLKQRRTKLRKKRTSAKIFGSAKKPRLCVARSAKHMMAELIDDAGGKVIATVSDAVVGKKTVGKRKRVVAAAPKDLGGRTTKVAVAYEVGRALAAKAKQLGIEAVVFDRRGFKYHGRVQAVAEGARDGGLKF